MSTADGSGTPLVSVLMPTHNRPVWLAGSVRSVLEGEFTDFELIVSNNGEPEHTRRLAEEIRDPRVRWVEYDRTSDMLEHLVSLLARATGKYVAVLHDDDWWDPTFLAKLVPALEARDDTVLAFADHHNVDGDGVPDPQAADRTSARFGRADRPQGYAKPFFDVVARQSAAMAGSIFRRDALDLTDVPAEMALVLDLWIVYGLARTGGAAYFHRDRLLYLRVHHGSATAKQFVTTYRGAIRCRERMLADPQMAPYASEIRGKLAHDHLSAGAALLREHARGEARRHLVASLRLRPHPKALLGLALSWTAPGAVLDRI